MVLRLIELFVLLLIARGILYAFRWFVAWLGRGKELDDAIKLDRVDADIIIRYRREGIHLNRQQIKAIAELVREKRDEYLDAMRLSWYQVIFIFMGGSVAGLILEEVWMYVTEHIIQSRVGLIWGPFSPLYGVGAVLLTIITFEMRKHEAKDWQIFLISVMVGGTLEQLTGWGMKTFMHVTSWDYIAGHVPGAITQWVALPFLVLWGILGVVWARLIMPELLYRIGMPTTHRQVVFVVLLALYLIADIFMTVACLERRAARNAGIPPQNAFQVWIDHHYDDQEMADIFQNMSLTPPDEK